MGVKQHHAKQKKKIKKTIQHNPDQKTSNEKALKNIYNILVANVNDCKQYNYCHFLTYVNTLNI